MWAQHGDGWPMSIVSNSRGARTSFHEDLKMRPCACKTCCFGFHCQTPKSCNSSGVLCLVGSAAVAANVKHSVGPRLRHESRSHSPWSGGKCHVVTQLRDSVIFFAHVTSRSIKKDIYPWRKKLCFNPLGKFREDHLFPYFIAHTHRYSPTVFCTL